MKRKGYIYDTMADWDLLKEAERISLANKRKNHGIRMHEKHRIRNLAYIQERILTHTMQTAEYQHEYKVSGQCKLRRISKLFFHPSHIQHQAIVLCTKELLEKSLISDTFASRIGYGQHLCAKRVNDWVQRHSDEYRWYLQIDIRKYYETIPHSLLRSELERRFKDKAYIEAYLETVAKFAPSGVGIPLGIPPSQEFGNIALSGVDRYIKDELKVHLYARYLDDAVFLLRTKAECWKVWNAVSGRLQSMGFSLHEPVVRRVDKGIDFMGYVTYPKRGQFIRKSNKVAWLRRRHGVTNKRRLREIDAAFWGLVKHGNKHGRRLYKKMGGINFSALGLKKAEHKDKDGRRILDAPNISMQMLLDREVTILDIVEGVKTKHGGDRMALLIDVMGNTNKLIVNASAIKEFVHNCWERGVTKMSVAFIDRGGRRYDIDYNRANIISVQGRDIEQHGDKIVFKDNGENVVI